MNPGKELFMMETAMQAMFPPNDSVFGKPALLFHYMHCGPGRRRTCEMEYVYMSFKQFRLFKKQNGAFNFEYHKEFKFDLASEFKIVVGMTVEHFKNEVIVKLYGTNSSSK